MKRSASSSRSVPPSRPSPPACASSFPHAGLDQAPELYRKYDRREAGVIKVVLNA
jgi:hypothetical protein